LKQGTSDPKIIELTVKAQWMMNGGKSSADWDALPLADQTLLIIDYSSKLDVEHNRMVNAVREGVYAKPKRNIEQ